MGERGLGDVVGHRTHTTSQFHVKRGDEEEEGVWVDGVGWGTRR